MRIILVCMRYGYGDPARGDSYEYYNFYARGSVLSALADPTSRCSDISDLLGVNACEQQ